MIIQSLLSIKQLRTNLNFSISFYLKERGLIVYTYNHESTMNQKLTNLTPLELRKLLIEESKKFNAAINFGSPVGDMEEIHQQIKEITEILQRKDSSISPDQR